MKMIKEFIYAYGEYHKFFISESTSFVGNRNSDGSYTLSIGQKVKYPSAYISFMYLSMTDWVYNYRYCKK